MSLDYFLLGFIAVYLLVRVYIFTRDRLILGKPTKIPFNHEKQTESFTTQLLDSIFPASSQVPVTQIYDDDPEFINDFIGGLKIPNDAKEDDPSAYGVELTLPELKRVEAYPKTIIDNQIRLEAKPIVNYVIRVFNDRINSASDQPKSFQPGELTFFSRQRSDRGIIYRVKFFAKEPASSITINILGEVVTLSETPINPVTNLISSIFPTSLPPQQPATQNPGLPAIEKHPGSITSSRILLPASTYLNFVQVIGGDPTSSFGWSGAE